MQRSHLTAASSQAWIGALILACGVLGAAVVGGAGADEGPAARRLPEGDTGIAASFPGDVGIERSPDVVFVESFETGTAAEIWKRWWKDQPQEEKHVRAQALSADVAAASSGKRSLKMTGTLGENTGSHLYTLLGEGLEHAFVRFTTKFASDAGYEHHFVCLGGYNPATRWPNPRAGTRPEGDDRLQVFIDPIGRNGRHPPPGAWSLYTYWPEMKMSADRMYWGNCIWPATTVPVPRDAWTCVELMIKLNAPAKRDGELALWVDGKLVLDVHEGIRRGPWSGMGFDVVESGGEPFEGLRLRTSEALKLNFLWLEHYVDEQAQTSNRVASPNKVNTVWFDDVVVARSYIGPVKAVTPARAR